MPSRFSFLKQTRKRVNFARQTIELRPDFTTKFAATPVDSFD
jgi:hypothetical protein